MLKNMPLTPYTKIKLNIPNVEGNRYPRINARIAGERAIQQQIFKNS